jgi:hypothetical protein
MKQLEEDAERERHELKGLREQAREDAAHLRQVEQEAQR